MPNVGDVSPSGRFTWNGTRWSAVSPPPLPPSPPCPPGPGPFLSPPATLASAAPQVVTASAATITGSSATIAGAGPVTLTLPAAPATGAWLYLVSTTPQLVVSSGANVAPLAGGSLGTAIFPAAAPHWCILQFNGTWWVTFAAG
jgi:hypothetical protein